MLLQLNPPIPFDYEGRHCLALLVLDYGVDYESMFLCAMEDDRTLWWLKQSKLRAVENITLGRVNISRKVREEMSNGTYIETILPREHI